MSEAGSTRQVNLYRNLALALSFLALVGWGTAYFARASAAVQHQLREEVAQLKASQDQLLAERDQAKKLYANKVAEKSGV
jgi:cell division protein FtsB